MKRGWVIRITTFGVVGVAEVKHLTDLIGLSGLSLLRNECSGKS